MNIYRQIIKPLADRIIALIGFIAASPLILTAMIALAIANKGRVWFLQPRPGLYGKIFKVIKFKTMNDARDEYGNLLPDHQRITRVGRFVRKTSLDELPQLMNVIIGDMSLVGPRPLLVDYLPLYNERQSLRHSVKPGITGWAQVNGRNAISWQQKFEYDVWYVEHHSFFIDLSILLKTIAKVFKADGINSAGSATMEKFKGNG